MSDALKVVLYEHRWINVLRDCKCNCGPKGQVRKPLLSWAAWIEHVVEVFDRNEPPPRLGELTW